MVASAKKLDSPLLAQWLASKHESPHAQAARYRAAKPFPHTVLHDFFKPAKAEALRRAIRALAKQGAFAHKESDLFSLAQSHDLKTEERGAIAELVGLFKSEEWRQYLQTLSGVRLSGKDLDIAASLYTDADYLLCHDDRVTGRKVAFIYYVSENFAVSDGGALVLFANKGRGPGAVVQRYPPRFNSLALFTVSARSWHAVEEVLTTKKRYSINGWFH